MPHLLLALALLTGCAVEPDGVAPSADPALASQTALARLDGLERKTDRLLAEVVANRQAIVALQEQVELQQGTIADLNQRLIVIDSTVTIQGGSLEIHDNALFRIEEGSGLRVDKLGALETRAGVVEDYAIGLAGGDTSGGTATSDDLLAALFVVDRDTGEIVPGVEGVQARLRKRPDLLVAEWDTLIDEQLTTLLENPLSVPGSLRGSIDSLDRALALQIEATAHFIDDWQGETASLRTSIASNTAAVADLDRRTQVALSSTAFELQLADDELQRQVGGLMCDVCVARGESPPSGADSCLDSNPPLLCGSTPHF